MSISDSANPTDLPAVFMGSTFCICLHLQVCSSLLAEKLLTRKFWVPRTSTNGGSRPAIYGVTQPISLAGPTPDDLESDAKLLELLKSYNLFESEEESEKRAEVLAKLNSIIKEWIKQCAIKKNLSEDIINNAGGKICAFGSYRLGVHNPGSDIDTLCVCPRHVDRDMFFTDLFEMLKKNKEITGLTGVPEAATPLIKMYYNGIDMDLLYARLGLPTIPEDINLLDVNLLKNLDEASVRSLNGSRVADTILSLVPNIEVFRIALRALKLWGIKRAVYSNILGYLGGVHLAILVARICQLYPNASAATIVCKFFRVLDAWQWPAPIFLCEIKDEGILANVRVWDPRLHAADRRHLMPIITPAYPCQNTSFNVTLSTLTLMKEEFKRGAEITIGIENKVEKWEKLFEPTTFFSNYRTYLSVCAWAPSEEEERLWAGFVESKLRFFVQFLQQTPGIGTSIPYAENFTNPTPNEQDGETKYNRYFFLGLTFDFSKVEDPTNKKVDLNYPTSRFRDLLSSWTSKKEDWHIRIVTTQRKNLPGFVFPSGVPPSTKRSRVKDDTERKKKKRKEKKRKTETEENKKEAEAKTPNGKEAVPQEESAQQAEPPEVKEPQSSAEPPPALLDEAEEMEYAHASKSSDPNLSNPNANLPPHHSAVNLTISFLN